MHIRPFNYGDQDYEMLVNLNNAIEPQTPSSVAAWKHYDSERDPKYLYRRYVYEQGGHIVALGSYGHTPWAHEADKYFVYVGVHPDQQGQGMGSAFYRMLTSELAARKPARLVAHTREHQARARRFLKDRGFVQIMRAPVSRLETATFDPGRYAVKLAQVAQSGIAIKTMAQVRQEDANWKRNLYELEWECLQDVPSPDPFTKQPFERWQRRVLKSPNLLPEAWFVAVDGDRYVGLSVLWKNLATKELLETGLTGVVRSYRRRGVATALKVHAIQYAKAHRVTAIETDNEENNPMFQLNLQLGFKPEPAHLDFEKKLDENEKENTASFRAD